MMTNELISAIRKMQKDLGLAASTRSELNAAGDLQQVHDKLAAALELRKQETAIGVAAPTAEPTVTDKELDKMLVRLNEYRILIQKKPLKAWKGTRDELAAAITEAKRVHKEGVKSTPTKTAATPKKPAVIAAIIANDAAVKKSIAAIVARELGIHPKIARAKLRAKFGSSWKGMDIKAIRAALKS